MGIIVEHFERRDEDQNPVIEFGLPEGNCLSGPVVSDFLQERMVRISDIKNLADMRLMYLSWVFDINFPATLAAIIERDYLSRLLSGLPKGSDAKKAKDVLYRYLLDKSNLS